MGGKTALERASMLETGERRPRLGFNNLMGTLLDREGKGFRQPHGPPASRLCAVRGIKPDVDEKIARLVLTTV